MTSPVLEATRALIDEDAFGMVVTIIAGPEAGAKAVLDHSGDLIAGSLPERFGRIGSGRRSGFDAEGDEHHPRLR